YHTPEATGTAKPDRVVKFVDDEKQEYVLGFGKETVDGIYATFNGSKTIYLMDKQIVESLDKKPDDFRDKAMSKSDPSKIVGISVKTSEGTTTMEKTGEKWLITGPVSARANMPAVDAIVREMSNITAVGFTKLKKTDARLDQPVATVTIQ